MKLLINSQHMVSWSGHRTSGYTLGEMLVSSAVGSLAIAAILTTYVFSVKSFSSIAHYAEIHCAGRHAVDVFARDMRAVNQVNSFSSTSLQVTVPTAFNNGAVGAIKTVTYVSSGGAFYRTDSSTGKTSMLATNIYQVTFKLYDRLGSNTTVIANSKGVQVDLKMRKYVISQIQSEDYLSARLDMRNK